MKQALVGGVLGILFAAVSSGCGGDERLSREQYVLKLSAMCEDFSAKEKEIGEPRTPADLVQKGPRILDAFENAIVNEVNALKAPDEIAPQADRMVDLANQQRDVLAGLINAARGNDFAMLRKLAAKNEALNREATSIAREIGAEACAED